MEQYRIEQPTAVPAVYDFYTPSDSQIEEFCKSRLEKLAVKFSFVGWDFPGEI